MEHHEIHQIFYYKGLWHLNSVHSPQVQSIPREGEASELKRIFRAPEGKVLVEVDLSQADYRGYALLSQNKWLLDFFEKEEIKGKDLYISLARETFGWNEKEAKEKRNLIKRILLGTLYDISPYGLARHIQVKPQIAKEWLNKIRNTVGAFRYYNLVSKQLISEKRVWSPTGRIRVFSLLEYVPPEKITYETLRKKLRYQIWTQAINAPIQSITSDVNLWIGSRVLDMMGEERFAQPILAVHDSLLWEVEEGREMELIDLVKRALLEASEGAPFSEEILREKWSWKGRWVVYSAEYGVGKTWYEATKNKRKIHPYF